MNYKKSFILFLIMLASNTCIYSQKLHWGINGGGNISYHSISNSSESKNSHNRTGWSIGIFTEISFGKNFRLAPEINYVNKGAEIERNNSSTTFISTKLSYISIPFKAKPGVSINNLFLFLLAGPRLDVHVGDDENGLEGLYKFRNNVNFGGSFGLGFSYSRNARRSLGLEITYNPDFTSYTVDKYITEGVTTTFVDGTKFRNETLELILTIGFR